MVGAAGVAEGMVEGAGVTGAEEEAREGDDASGDDGHASHGRDGRDGGGGGDTGSRTPTLWLSPGWVRSTGAATREEVRCAKPNPNPDPTS